MKLYISGLSGDRQSGIGSGVARAIRNAYPNARLVAVNYASPGRRVAWPDFDEQWDAGPWHALNSTEHRRDIKERLDDGAWWLAGLPKESHWLAETLANHERVLNPPLAALQATAPVSLPLASHLGLCVPASIPLTAPDWDLNAFGRRHGWRVWLRRQDAPGQRIPNWQSLHQARGAFENDACADGYYDARLQQDIEGTAETLAFVAWRGELLDCALCAQNEATSAEEWPTRRIDDVPASLAAALARTLEALCWTGGGFLSVRRDSAGQRWALRWQTGFPDWVFGAALAAHNLPARLLERATGEAAAIQPKAAREFVRVMVEVPLTAAENDQLTAPRDVPDHEAVFPGDSTATPASMDAPNASASQIPAETVADVASAAADLQETPAFLFLPEAARHAFRQAEDLMQRCSSSALRVQVAYSVKTNPDRRLLEMAQQAGLLAETISQAEMKKALDCGFSPGRIILNGPAKRWPAPQPLSKPLHAIFCDSLEELRTAVAAIAAGEPDIYRADVLGIRLRPPQIASRFGIPLASVEATEQVVALVRQLPTTQRLGIHFHMGSNAIGLDRWWRLFTQMVETARTIETASGHSVVCLDLGGGWFPDDWADELSPRFEQRILRLASDRLPHLREVLLEPGRALAQASMALAVRVLEVRHEADGRIGDVVVDGSIAELAYHNYTIFPHRLLLYDRDTQRWQPLGRGDARILGRLCMEKDILAEAIDVPNTLAIGDLLIFCDAGAYDRSMSYSFGQGEVNIH